MQGKFRFFHLRGKKAVSPLIATVLLIAFSVALGAVVMNWGRTFVGEQTKKVDTDSEIVMKCSVDILLQYVEINSREQVCLESGTGNLRIIVQNLGSQNATGVSIRFIDDIGSVYTYTEASGDLAAGAAKKYNVTRGYGGMLWTNLTYLAVSPMIRTPGASSNQVCSGNKIETSSITTC
jgi:flagellin-like protein